MRAVRVQVGAVVLGVLALAGCSTSGGGAVASPTASSTPAPTASLDLDQFTPGPTGVVDEDTGEVVQDQDVPVWDEESRAAATKAARVAMTAFAHPEMDFDTWWEQLSPLLTQQAQMDYAYVDPANIPARTVSGDPELVDETSVFVAHVQVPTDVGDYTLILTRADATSPWLTSRFTPPDGVN